VARSESGLIIENVNAWRVAVRSIAWLDVLVSVAINLGQDDMIARVDVNVEKSVIHPLECPAANTVFVYPSVGKTVSTRAAVIADALWWTEQLHDLLLRHTGANDLPDDIAAHASARIRARTGCTPRGGREPAVIEWIKRVADQYVDRRSCQNNAAHDPSRAT
jgi:hypothetical protein